MGWVTTRELAAGQKLGNHDPTPTFWGVHVSKDLLDPAKFSNGIHSVSSQRMYELVFIVLGHGQQLVDIVLSARFAISRQRGQETGDRVRKHR